MIITAIQIRPKDNTGTKMKGIASITLDGMIAIHDTKILQHDDSMFLAMPVGLLRRTLLRMLCIQQTVRTTLERLIVDAYHLAIKQHFMQLDLHLRSASFKASFYEYR